MKPLERVLILDFGSQYTQLIARRVRELSVYSEIHPCTVELDRIREMAPSAIILSGGPSSVYEDDAPHPDPGLFALGVPMLGICYGMQLMAYPPGRPGGRRQPAGVRPGRTDGFQDRPPVCRTAGNAAGLDEPWGPHRGAAAGIRRRVRRQREFPGGGPWAIRPASCTGSSSIRKWPTRPGAGKCWPISCSTWWAFPPPGPWPGFIQRTVEELRERIGDGHVICALSGGVDSSVTAALLQRAVGDRLTCVFVDNGLLREGEADAIVELFRHGLAVKLIHVDAADRFLSLLAGVEDPERKRRIIGREFIAVFEAEAAKLGSIRYLAQGTLYPDVIESVSFKGPSATIKTHHNVGGLPEVMGLELVEPLRELFKDEVRKVGLELGLPESLVFRQPFPGPGPGRAHPGRGHGRTRRRAAQGRRHRAGGDPARGPAPPGLAVFRGCCSRSRPWG